MKERILVSKNAEKQNHRVTEGMDGGKSNKRQRKNLQKSKRDGGREIKYFHIYIINPVNTKANLKQGKVAKKM